MIEETTYSSNELESGTCTCCSEQSSEILIGDGRCIDCVEDEKFFDETMKGL